MGQRIVFTRPDGGVSVITPADPHADMDWLATETLAKSGYGPLPFEVVEEEELPPRRFRQAWKQSGKSIAVDLAEAKKVRVAELEQEATALLEAAAKEHMIALAKGDNAAATAARQKVQALAALDKAALEADVAAVADLETLDKHEPKPIKDAKPVKPR